MRLDFGDDWAEIRPADRIPHGKTLEYRKVFFRVIAAAGDSEAEVDDDDLDPAARAKVLGRAYIKSGAASTHEDLAIALVLAVVKDWSFGEITEKVLCDEVPTSVVRHIANKCGTDEYVQMLQPDFGVSGDPDSPTKPSEP